MVSVHDQLHVIVGITVEVFVDRQQSIEDRHVLGGVYERGALVGVRAHAFDD
jgi:hypothetical protein